MPDNSYFLRDVAVNGFGSLAETDPGASTMGTGWVVAKLAAGNFSKLLYGTERASGTFSTTDALTTPAAPASGDSWRTENTISGIYANANWTLTFRVRAVTAASSQTGRVKCRIWRSVNADGTSATQITSSILTGSTTAALSTSADATSTVTFTPGGTVTLNNEYLFIQCEWEIVGVSGNNSGDVDFRASASTVATANITNTSVASASGAGAATAIGVGLGIGVGSAAGAGATSAIGSAVNPAPGSAAGAGAAAAVGSAIGAAVTYYISAAGNDSNDGLTTGTPWLTIAKVNAATQAPGNTFSFRGGDTFSDATLTVNASGTAGNPITFTSYGTGKATIAKAADHGFYCLNRSYITVSNLIFSGDATMAKDGMFLNYPSGTNSDVTLDGCQVSGYGRNGIHVLASDIDQNLSVHGYLSNLTISNCITSNNCLTNDPSYSGGTSGLIVQGAYGANVTGIYGFTNALIENCYSHDNVGQTDSINWSGSGIVVSCCDNSLVQYCVAHGNVKFGPSGFGGISIGINDCRNTIMQYCESYNNGNDSSQDGGGFYMDDGCKSCITQYCYSHGNKGHGFSCQVYGDPGRIETLEDCILRFCIAEGNCQNQNITDQGEVFVVNNYDGFIEGGVSSIINLQVYGNVFYGTSARLSHACILTYNNDLFGDNRETNMEVTYANNIIYSGANDIRLVSQPGVILNTQLINFYSNDYYWVGLYRTLWNNVFYNSSNPPPNSFPEWQAASGKETLHGTDVALTDDPLLIDPGNGGTINVSGSISAALLHGLTAYQVQAGSPMRQAGLNITLEFGMTLTSEDFYGNPVSAKKNSLSVGADWPIPTAYSVDDWLGVAVFPVAVTAVAGSFVVTTSATATASATGVGAATGTALIIATGSASATGVGAAIGMAMTVASATASASGTGTANGVSPGVAYTVSDFLGVATFPVAGAPVAGSEITIAAIGSAVGTASGTGTASAISSAAVGVGSASGLGSANAVGTGIKSAIAAASGTGVATAIGFSFAVTTVSAAGTGTANGVGRATAASQAQAQGNGTAVGISDQGAAQANAAGTGAASAVGRALVPVTASASGTGTATATGRATFTAVAAAAGSGVANGIGRATAASTASASGTGAALAVSPTVSYTVDDEAGIAAVALSSAPIAGADIFTNALEAVAAATGIGTANAIGVAFSNAIAAAAGTGTAIAPATGFVAATASASGTGTAVAVGIGNSGSNAQASGVGTGTATGQAIASATASAAGIGSAAAIFSSSVGVGSAPGVGTASAIGTGLKPATASASGTGAATATGTNLQPRTASASGAGTAIAASQRLLWTIGNASGTGTAQALTAATAASVGTAAGLGEAFGDAPSTPKRFPTTGVGRTGVGPTRPRQINERRPGQVNGRRPLAA